MRRPKQNTLTTGCLHMTPDSKKKEISIEQASHTSNAYQASKTLPTVLKVCSKKNRKTKRK